MKLNREKARKLERRVRSVPGRRKKPTSLPALIRPCIARKDRKRWGCDWDSRNEWEKVEEPGSSAEPKRDAGNAAETGGIR